MTSGRGDLYEKYASELAKRQATDDVREAEALGGDGLCIHNVNV